MLRNRLAALGAAAALAAFCAAPAGAATVRITEWQYNGSEFIEFTNLDAGAVNFSGWSFADSGTNAGAVSLSGFGIVNEGESVILAEESASSFRTRWGLASSVDVIGGNTVNLGRGDTIKLFNASNVLVDQLVYGDQVFPGTLQTSGVSGLPSSSAALGANNPALWIYASVGDAYGSRLSTSGGYIGNPGTFVQAPQVPLPAAAWLLLSGLGGLGVMQRRRKAA